ncbi:hypothetical protein GGS21DRAFT_488203 [Xylaria nigripes]|nr:hypothetical protein GGS21DRAFT_488203 [Xylaria nigripes]
MASNIFVNPLVFLRVTPVLASTMAMRFSHDPSLFLGNRDTAKRDPSLLFQGFLRERPLGKFHSLHAHNSDRYQQLLCQFKRCVGMKVAGYQ